jgi:hypothetical protein
MSKRRIVWSLGSIAAIAAVIVVGSLTSQTRAQILRQRMRHTDQQVQQDTMSARADQSRQGSKASELIGMDVRGPSGDDNIGSINDLVIGHEGRVTYVAASFGGFLGMGDKLFAVPFEAIDFVKTDDEAYARMDVREETLKQKKGFNQDKWPTEADRTFETRNLRRQAATPGVSR